MTPLTLPMAVPLIPESAPFTPGQRAWLNGFFAGLLNVDPAGMPLSEDSALFTPAASATAASVPTDVDQPWHDSAMPLAERLKLAAERPVADKLMAAMAQLDCGACGYLCRTYSTAIADGSEKDLTRCVPGGKDTARSLKQILKETPLTISAAAVSASAPVATVTPSPVTDAPQAQTKIDRENPYLATVLAVKPLNGEGSAKDTRFVAVDITNSGLTYAAGDSLGIYPRNCYEQVDAIIRIMGFSGAEPVFSRAARHTTLREAMIADGDIELPRDELFLLLAEVAGDPQQKRDLQSLAEGGNVSGLVDDPRVLDVVARFGSARPTAAQFISALPKLQPRLYSISSSPRKFPEEIHLTVGVVRYEKGGLGRKGVASTFLADRVMLREPVRVFVQPSHGFRPPTDPAAPMIMIGPGTGIAPFRAFLQDRAAAGHTGKNWLFFGDQCGATDFLYQQELTGHLTSGLLTRLDTAFSRDQSEKIYVQHRILENAAELWSWLRDGAHVYVCGDAKRMAADVHAALLKVAVQVGHHTEASAKEYLAALAREHRYCRDVY